MSKAAEILESIQKRRYLINKIKNEVEKNERVIEVKLNRNSALNKMVYSEYEDLNRELFNFSELMNEIVDSAKPVSFRDRGEILTGRARWNDPITSSLTIYVEHLNQTFAVPYISLILD